MKKTLLFALVLSLSISRIGCANGVYKDRIKEEQSKAELNIEDPQKTDVIDENTVGKLVEDFGKKLQTVSLLAPTDVLNKSMKDNYGDLISPTLLLKWQSDSENAPGRMVSSPWPDRIEIQTIVKLSDYVYEVKGEVIEITSTEADSGEIAAKRAITLKVEKIDNRWVIDDVMLGAYEN